MVTDNILSSIFADTNLGSEYELLRKTAADGFRHCLARRYNREGLNRVLEDANLAKDLVNNMADNYQSQGTTDNKGLAY